MSKIPESKYTHRLLAQIVIEAATPLAVGNGNKDIFTDSLVATDCNGLPYIPATSIAGVMRGMREGNGSSSTSSPFGYLKGDEGHGSELIFTSAKVIGADGKVVDGMAAESVMKDPILSAYSRLPIRQHVCINDRGTAADKGKFDRQVVYAGSRFCFEIELVAKNGEEAMFSSLLDTLFDRTFRIGGHTRAGMGEIKVVSIKRLTLDLTDPADLDTYLAKSSCLASTFWDTHGEKVNGRDAYSEEYRYIRYDVALAPDSFFLFSSGFGDDEADIMPVKGARIIWENGKGRLRENLMLIPATSIKGALAHRTAFHYNHMKGIFADKISDEERKMYTGNRNPAVKALFGSQGDASSRASRGNVIISDIIGPGEGREKILNHVKLDRFSGGAVEGALFSEKVTSGKGTDLHLYVIVDRQGLVASGAEDFEMMLDAFEKALADLCGGNLPLGGGVNRGHGRFTRTYTK